VIVAWSGNSVPVGVIVSGFDSYVSYAYPGGTDLMPINAIVK
jgi:hypothetical protein